jgi:hypothetical protein
VVWLTEAIRAEVRDTNIETSVVMPIVVHTELGSGLPETRGFKAVEPEDVAAAIIEALQTGRFDVFVPKSIGGLFRAQALVPRRAMERIARTLKGDQVLMAPDHGARAAYEARMATTVTREAGDGPSVASEAAESPASDAAPQPAARETQPV